MLKEESVLRDEVLMTFSSKFIRTKYRRLITALVKAVREDCVKKADWELATSGVDAQVRTDVKVAIRRGKWA
jgi:hypothetical protein